MPIFEANVKQANRPRFGGWVEQTAIIGAGEGWQPTTLAVSKPWQLQGHPGIDKHVLVESWVENHFCPVFAVSGSRL